MSLRLSIVGDLNADLAEMQKADGFADLVFQLAEDAGMLSCSRLQNAFGASPLRRYSTESLDRSPSNIARCSELATKRKTFGQELRASA